MTLRATRNQAVYTAIQDLLQEDPDYPIRILCELGGISRSAYYKWGSHVHTEKEDFNEMLAKKTEQFCVSAAKRRYSPSSSTGITAVSGRRWIRHT